MQNDRKQEPRLTPSHPSLRPTPSSNKDCFPQILRACRRATLRRAAPRRAAPRRKPPRRTAPRRTALWIPVSYSLCLFKSIALTGDSVDNGICGCNPAGPRWSCVDHYPLDDSTVKRALSYETSCLVSRGIPPISTFLWKESSWQATCDGDVRW